VKFNGNFYSVPGTYHSRIIILNKLVDRIKFIDGRDINAAYRWLAGKREYRLDITHYIKTFHPRPGTLPNYWILAPVDELIRDMFNRYYLDDPKKIL
jgi:hypothetical protein